MSPTLFRKHYWLAVERSMWIADAHRNAKRDHSLYWNLGA